MKSLYRRSVPKPPPARETHESISTQTDAYLSHGGTIQIIPQGFTGRTDMAGPGQLQRPLKFRH